jgi:hypothetical protein
VVLEDQTSCGDESLLWTSRFPAADRDKEAVVRFCKAMDLSATHTTVLGVGVWTYQMASAYTVRFDCTPEAKPNSKIPPLDFNVVVAFTKELSARVLLLFDIDKLVTETMRHK